MTSSTLNYQYGIFSYKQVICSCTDYAISDYDHHSNATRNKWLIAGQPMTIGPAYALHV